MRSSGSAPARRPGETADDYIRRLTARPDFARLCGSYRVQDALAEAQREAASARRKTVLLARVEQMARGGES